MGTGSNVPLIAGLAQGAVELGGAAIQTRAIQAQADFNRKASQSRIAIEEFRIRDIIKRGRTLESQHRKRVARLLGRQRVSFAAQGIDIGQGTALEVQIQTQELGDLDALMIRTNAKREELGARIGVEGLRTQATLRDVAAETEAEATLLTGGLQFARSVLRGTMDYYKLNPPRQTDVVGLGGRPPGTPAAPGPIVRTR